MSRLHPRDMNVGDVFCEHDSFSGTITAKVTIKPYTEGKLMGRPQWRWKATNEANGSEIDYLLTEGMEHYGPRIYTVGSVLLPRPMPKREK